MVSHGRARSGADKLARRLEIIETATELWEQTSYADLTMSQIAAKLNLAKGTLYLYFPSKEELFLAVYVGLLDQWFDHVERTLEKLTLLGPAVLADAFISQLLAQPNLIRLIPLVAPGLEHNIRLETAVDFKRWLHKRVDQLSVLVAYKANWLSTEKAAEAYLYFHALVAGLAPMAATAPSLAGVWRYEELAPLKVDLPTALKASFTATLDGMGLWSV